MTCWRALPLVLVGLVLPSGCSFILDFDGEITDGAPGPDAELADADPLAPDAPPSPITLYEPNDTQAEATPIDVGVTYGPIALRPLGEHDFYSFTIAEAHDVTIDCTFVTAGGDLDIRLYDATMVKIGESTGFMDNEKIVKPQLGAGTYAVEVYGFNNERTNDDYRLLVTAP